MLNSSKSDYRNQFNAKRLLLTDVEYRNLNEELLAHFKQISLEGIKYIHTFLPISKKKEPNTLLFIDYLRKAWPTINIVVPKSDLLSNNMTHHVFLPGQELVSNAWGIVEPVSEHLVDISLIDMVLVPLLAFDKQGHRIGYGKGYYDRFLSHCPHAKKIGLSFFDPIDEITAPDPHDIPLDFCITPKKIWSFFS